MNTTQAIKLVVNLWHDDQVDDPTEENWTVVSFSSRHNAFRHPDEFEDNAEHAERVKAGLAFPLSYFEHGQCLWTLAGELPPGADCPFDSVGLAGWIIWERDEEEMGAETVEDRRKDAAAFIEHYTNWCNGQVFGYTIEAFKVCECCGQDTELSDEEAGLDLPSCGGYYPDDIDGMVIDMKDHIGDDWASYKVEFKEQHGYGLADECGRRWKGE